jgi:hypothetical protein
MMVEGDDHLLPKEKLKSEFNEKGYDVELEYRLDNGEESVIIEVGTLSNPDRIEYLKEYADKVIHLPQFTKDMYRTDKKIEEIRKQRNKNRNIAYPKVRERNDGVKLVTIPADSEIEAGDHVKITKLETDNKLDEEVIEEAMNRLQKAIDGETELHELDDVLEDDDQ